MAKQGQGKRGGVKLRRRVAKKYWFDRYRNQHRRERNKVRKLEKHILAHPNDIQAGDRIKAEDLRGYKAHTWAYRAVYGDELPLKT